MTKEELLNLDEEDLHDFVEKFCVERYFKLNDEIPHFKDGDMGQPYIQKDVVRIPYYVECRGSGDYGYFEIPLDYFTMTDEEILRRFD